MGNEFPMEQLDRFVLVQGGFAFKSSDFSDTGVPVLKIKNIRLRDVDTTDVEYVAADIAESASRYFCRFGDLLISMTGSGPQAPNSIVGRVARFTGPNNTYLINQRVGRFIIKNPDLLDSRFLFYVLTQTEFQWRLVSIATGSANQANISGNQVVSLEIPVPPLPEQRAIAAILGALDDKIELNRRINATLEATARALFKSWFVDFDPVRAKAAGEQPSSLAPHIADLFPDEFVDSELGEIPKGWRVEPIGNIVRVVGGGTPSTKNNEYWDDGIHYFATPKDMSALSAPILLETERRVTDAGLAQISSGLLPAGAVLLSSRAPVGYLALAQVPVCVNQGFIAMICDGPVSNYYILNWTFENMGIIKGRASGTTFAEISKQNFRPILALVPPEEIVTAYDNLVTPLYEKITLTLQESRTLAALRDTLLPKLLSGELRVQDAKRFMEAKHE